MVAEFRENRASLSECHARLFWSPEPCQRDAQPMGGECQRSSTSTPCRHQTGEHGNRLLAVVQRRVQVTGGSKESAERRAAPDQDAVGARMSRSKLIFGVIGAWC